MVSVSVEGSKTAAAMFSLAETKPLSKTDPLSQD